MRPLITPTYRDCLTLVRAGADILAVEATTESPMDAAAFVALVRRVHSELGVPVMADVSTYSEGIVAWQAGADLVGTTLSGYTGRSSATEGPDLALLEHLVSADVRVVLEGRVNDPTDVAEGFVRGAWAVVVGKAITDPLATSERFSLATPRRDRHHASLLPRIQAN
jgi:N-acylglucosamine-6-phosphate 2-epimerase